jgi:hypothetical protein
MVDLSIFASSLYMQMQIANSIPYGHLIRLKKLSCEFFFISDHLSDYSSVETSISSYLLLRMVSLRAIFNPDGREVGENLCLFPNYVLEFFNAI